MTQDAMFKPEKKRWIKLIGIAALMVIVLTLVGSGLAGLFAVSMAAWGWVSGLMIMITVMTVGFFMMAWLWLLLSCVGAVMLVLLTLFLLPLTLPLLVPVLVVMLVVAVLSRSGNEDFRC